MRILPFLAVLIPLIGSAADNSLQATLARIDSAAAKYKGMKADFSRTMHLEVINQNDTETGSVVARRTNPKDLRMLILIGPPNPRKVLVGAAKAEIYYPKMNQVEEYELGKIGALKDQLLLLSFGATSKDLLAAYTVTGGPAETVAGQKSTRLDLIPKNKQIFTAYPKIQVWISDETGMAVQQKLIEPTKDFNLAIYTNMALGNVTDADLKLDIPKNAERKKIR
jgi:outer membrane lipoprotein-sorting protein